MNLRVSSDVGKSSDELLLEIDEVTKEFKMLTDDLTKFNQIETVCKLQPSSDLGGIPGEDAGFKEQIRQLDELKNTRRYKSKVFPFLAVDPRRPGILEYLKKNVGRGKRFIGIKLYSPNGYSPTDPLLFESSKNCNCIYKFCEKNHIPVTVHNSFGGFATFMNQIEITGDIYTPDGLKYLNKELYSFQYSFLTKPGNAIRERALLLNHPSLWEKVLKKYPNLYINFAHFGGSDCLEKAIDNVNDLESGNWGQKIIELIKTYPNAYTDLSCFIEFTILKKLKNSSIYLDIKEHVLYGSDFYFIMLAENDFKKNIKNFKDVFADDFNLISRDNPKRFLKHVIKWKDLTSKVSKSLKGGFI
jgi:predicted TIM-barrel fold metal-dependent hydrolase